MAQGGLGHAQRSAAAIPYGSASSTAKSPFLTRQRSLASRHSLEDFRTQFRRVSQTLASQLATYPHAVPPTLTQTMVPHRSQTRGQHPYLNLLTLQERKSPERVVRWVGSFLVQIIARKARHDHHTGQRNPQTVANHNCNSFLPHDCRHPLHLEEPALRPATNSREDLLMHSSKEKP